MPACPVCGGEVQGGIIYNPRNGLLDSYLLAAIVLVDPIDRLWIEDDPLVTYPPLEDVTDVEHRTGVRLIIPLGDLPLPGAGVRLPGGIYLGFRAVGV